MICLGPMSPEVIECAFKYSSDKNTPLSLIASKNQIDYNGGYVNNWTTHDYAFVIYEMKKKYPGSKISICRDHCGPGFNGSFDLQDVYNTISCDIECGFDLIHMDFCHFSQNKKEVVKETINAIEYALKLDHSIEFEIGTDEISEVPNLKEIEKNLKIFSVYDPKYYVVNTGSMIKDMHQVGNFNTDFMMRVNKLFNLKDYDILIKEHNADYLSCEEISLRNGLVDAVNIAPQLGVIQTKTVISCAEKHGVDTHDFLNTSYESGKWSKWIYKANPNDKFSLAVMAGHYNYTSPEYISMVNKLYKLVDLNQLIESEIYKIIDHYEQTNTH